MKLTREDKAWLDRYRKAIEQQFPDLVQQVIVFGSKARGTARPDSDVDVLVVIREGDWRLKEQVAACGHDLAIGTEVVPSILVYTQSAWEEMASDEAPFWRTVNRDGVAVA